MPIFNHKAKGLVRLATNTPISRPSRFLTLLPDPSRLHTRTHTHQHNFTHVVFVQLICATDMMPTFRSFLLQPSLLDTPYLESHMPIPATSPPIAPKPHVPTALQRQIPNILTISRVIMAFAFFAILSFQRPVTQSTCLLALVLFVAAAITDALDGYLARKWNATSQFGRVMDPFADKILVVGAFVFLAGPGFLWVAPGPASITYMASGVLPWMAVVVLARELLVTSLRAMLESQGRDCSATTSGKLKMIAQSFAIPIILLLLVVAPVYPGTSARIAIQILAYATVAITAFSGIPYVMRSLEPSNKPIS